MLIGAFSTAFDLSNDNSLIINAVLAGGFVLACCVLKGAQQIMVAQLLTLVYALIMIAVSKVCLKTKQRCLEKKK